MAKEALINSINGKKVFAKNLVANDSTHDFYCATENCHARMYGYALGSPNARFNSYNINEHISSACIGRELEFNDHDYAENLFSLESFAAQYEGNAKAMGSSKTNRSTGIGPISISNRSKTAINTIGSLYAMCCKRGINGTYNDIPISSFFACRDNYEDKSKGFTGFHIVEASFYKFEKDSPYMVFNYPPYGSSKGMPAHICLIFANNKEMFKFYRSHFRDTKTMKAKTDSHTRLIVVGGLWRESSRFDCIAECNIVKQTQFRFIG